MGAPYRTWCRTDPTVKIGDAVGKLTVMAPAEFKRGADAVTLLVGRPAGTAVSISQNTILGANVTLEERDAPDVWVALVVDAAERFAVIGHFRPAGSHDLPDLFGAGATNEGIPLAPVEAG